jgi:hypothetical protein
VLAGRKTYALIAAVVVAGAGGASIALRTTSHRAPSLHPTPVLTVRPPSSGANNWDLIRAAASLRQNALAPKRTTFHRAFAAYMGLSALMQIHERLAGRCAIAVSYLYDNLLDLHDAYSGEDWAPLRQAVAGEPSLAVCAPRKGRVRVRYVS